MVVAIPEKSTHQRTKMLQGEVHVFLKNKHFQSCQKLLSGAWSKVCFDPNTTDFDEAKDTLIIERHKHAGVCHLLESKLIFSKSAKY